MQHRHRHYWMLGITIVAGLGLAGCNTASIVPPVIDSEVPSSLEHIEGSELSRVTLSERAAQRLGIELAEVSSEELDGSMRQFIPYGAVIYDADGATWTYTSAEPLSFVRHAITIDTIDGDRAWLSEGPPDGTSVVSVGAAELYGTEYEVGH
jgi:hypothetical protein